jgi:hypothetical protein
MDTAAHGVGRPLVPANVLAVTVDSPHARSSSSQESAGRRPGHGGHAMQYALLIYTPEREGEVPPEELADEMDGYNAFTEHVRSNGAMKGGEALDSVATATTVRVVDGKTITTDGPFAETKETLGGFYLIEAADLDEAIAYAAMLPGAKRGCIEVRPVWDYQIAGLEPAASAAAGN